MGKILNFGSLNIDTVYSLPHIVQPGETIAAEQIDWFCGGKGLNQSVALARAGCAVSHAGKIGSDGGMLRRELQKNGISCDHLMEGDVHTGNALIQRSHSGENCIILYGGANQAVTTGEINDVLANFGPGDILVAQNEISHVPDLLGAAAEKKLRIALNPSPMDDTLKQFPLDGITWLIINEIEGNQLTGREGPEDIADTLLARYNHLQIVLTLGGKGSLYASREERFTQAAYAVPTVDTTGAGDTFLGYFVGLTAQGHSTRHAMQMASAASALAVSVAGAVPSIPEIQAVHHFIKERENQ